MRRWTTEIPQILEMRFKQRMKLREIAERFDTTPERIGHLIARILDGESNRKSPVTQYYTRSLGGAPRPPIEVMSDRERRVNADLTPNMVVLGDPRPGQSMLDRMRHEWLCGCPCVEPR